MATPTPTTTPAFLKDLANPLAMKHNASVATYM